MTTAIKTETRDARSRGEWQGMNWVRQTTRLAIYLRDGMACAYCGHSVEDGASLSLDHLTPHSQGGSNEATNLVTACTRCNASRGDRPVARFCAAVAEYLDRDIDSAVIAQRIFLLAAQPLGLYRAEANALIARRGSVSRVLAGEKS